MDKTLRDILILLELSTAEIKFFESCFLLGNPTISDVIKDAKIERSTGYLIAQNLIKKGFIFEDYKQYGKRLVTVDPKTLLSILSTKRKSLAKKELELSEKLPSLQALTHLNIIRPRVKVFEGNKGLIVIWNDILSERKNILLWTNQETEESFFTPQNHQKFIEERIKRNITIHVLAVNNEKAKKLQRTDAIQLRITKLLPKETIFSSEIYIYGNKVAVIDFNKQVIGVITESEKVANSHRAIFNLAWSQIK